MSKAATLTRTCERCGGDVVQVDYRPGTVSSWRLAVLEVKVFSSFRGEETLYRSAGIADEPNATICEACFAELRILASSIAKVWRSALLKPLRD